MHAIKYLATFINTPHARAPQVAWIKWKIIIFHMKYLSHADNRNQRCAPDLILFSQEIIKQKQQQQQHEQHKLNSNKLNEPSKVLLDAWTIPLWHWLRAKFHSELRILTTTITIRKSLLAGQTRFCCYCWNENGNYSRIIAIERRRAAKVEYGIGIVNIYL